MAYAITNVTNPFTAVMWESSVTSQQELTAVDGTPTTVDFNAAVFKAARVILNFKTFGTLTTGDTVTVTLQVGTGAAVTSPKNIAQKVVTVISGDTTIGMQLFGISQSFFRSCNLIVTTSSSHTVTYDVQIEVA
jgi:hypothetical protein